MVLKPSSTESVTPGIWWTTLTEERPQPTGVLEEIPNNALTFEVILAAPGVYSISNIKLNTKINVRVDTSSTEFSLQIMEVVG